MLHIEEIESTLAQEEKELFSHAKNLIMQAYLRTKREYNSNYMVFEEIIWDKNYNDFLSNLRSLNIDKIIIANTSTELMRLLHFLISNGCEIETVAEVGHLHDEFAELKKGLIIKL